MKVLFSLLQGRTGSHIQSEIFNPNISDQSRIENLKGSLEIFQISSNINIQIEQCTPTDRSSLFPHGSRWASDRMVLTWAYPIIGTQKVKRYIPHPLTPMTAHPKTPGRTVLSKPGSTSILGTLETSSPLEGLSFFHSDALVESTFSEQRPTIATSKRKPGTNFVGFHVHLRARRGRPLYHLYSKGPYHRLPLIPFGFHWGRSGHSAPQRFPTGQAPCSGLSGECCPGDRQPNADHRPLDRSVHLII